MNDSLSRLAADSGERQRLAQEWSIPELVWLEETTSTQNEARERIEAGATAWTLVVADVQHEGRGQHGRQWNSPAGHSLLMSVIMRPSQSESIGLIPIRVGQAVACALDELIGETPQTMLKWPNDLIVEDGKMGGVLCESQIRGDECVAVVGIGLNVHPFEFKPDEMRSDLPPRFLANYLPEGVGRLEVLEAVVRHLRGGVTTFLTELTPMELHRYRSRDWLYNRTLTSPVPGRGAGINAFGHLQVLRSDNVMETIISGRVIVGGGA